MKTQIQYLYIGENGVMESPIKIPGATNLIERVYLTADEGKVLWNGIEKRQVVMTTREGVKEWKEIFAI